MQFLTALGLAVPAGLNAYIPLLAVGVAQRFGLLQLREPFGLLGEWWALALMGVLLIVEMIADKVPAADHVNDIIHTLIRPAAGGVLVLATTPVASNVDPALLVFLGVLAAGGVHVVKATSRPVVNATTGGFGAPVASAIEDTAALVTSVLAIVAPVLVGVALLLIVAFFIWLYRRKRRRKAATASA